MTFDSMKLSDERQAAVFTKTKYYILTDPIRAIPLTPEKVAPNNLRQGIKRVSYFNRTKWPRGGWKSTGKSRRLNVILNPVDHRKYEGSFTEDTVTVFRTYNRVQIPYVTLSGNVAGYTDIGDPDDLTYPVSQNTSAEQRVLQLATAKMAEPDFDTAMAIAEMRQTVELLISPFAALKRYAKKLRRKKTFRRPSASRRAGTTVNYATDAWLQYRYGIMPLVYDVASICDMYTKKSDFDTSIRDCRSRVVLDKTEMVSPIHRIEHEVHFTGFDTVTTELSYNAKVYWRVKNATLHQLTEVGLNPLYIANLAWELIPFSFIVDWGFNVGAWLRSCTPDPNIQNLGSCTGTRTRKTIERTFLHATYEYGWVDCLFSHKISVDKFTRRTDVPLPAVPTVNHSIFNLKRSLDTLSLSWGLNPFKKR